MPLITWTVRRALSNRRCSYAFRASVEEKVTALRIFSGKGGIRCNFLEACGSVSGKSGNPSGESDGMNAKFKKQNKHYD